MDREDQRLIYAVLGVVAGVAFLFFGNPDSEHLIALCVFFASLVVAEDISLLSKSIPIAGAFLAQLLFVLLVVFQLPLSITIYSGFVSIPLSIVYGLLLRYGFRQVGENVQQS